MATADCRTGGGLNSSSGGELKLYLKGKRNTAMHGPNHTHFPATTHTPPPATYAPTTHPPKPRTPPPPPHPGDQND